MVLQNDIDLLNPPVELEKRKHKLKRLVQTPNSFFMVSLLLLLYSIFYNIILIFTILI
ncbi:putative ribosomal protein S27e [Lupinus albus]|uniref:Putative ribosomal protein S27e n=1 Tax=Lupinus albus TaxID=3870 RepID=A0A6A4QNZ1_LUPAL|nr:putative ribosomal protein S27e [Lupinus albus]